MGGEKEKWEVRNGWWAEQKQCRHLHGQNFEINERVGCDQHMAEPRAIIYSLKKKKLYQLSGRRMCTRQTIAV